MKVREYLLYIEAAALVCGDAIMWLFGKNPLEPHPLYYFTVLGAMMLTLATAREGFFAYMYYRLFRGIDDGVTDWEEEDEKFRHYTEPSPRRHKRAS